MRVLIHAVPKRMWYVEKFLAPSLEAQGLEPVIWNDATGYGCLESCLRSFEAGLADWHIQDDVLICRDFSEKIKDLDGVVNGFCHTQFGDNPEAVGKIYPPDLWHGFPCVRIPIDMAKEFVEWVKGTNHTDTGAVWNIEHNKGDDYLFRLFFTTVHKYDMATNIPLVEHVDLLIGGSVVSEWRSYWCRNTLWNDEALVDELREKLNKLNLPP